MSRSIQQDPESEKCFASKRKLNIIMTKAKENEKRRGQLEAHIQKRDKDEIEMKAQIEKINKIHVDKIRELENEISLLKKINKPENYDINDFDDEGYLHYKAQEFKRLENEPNRYSGWIGTLIKYA